MTTTTTTVVNCPYNQILLQRRRQHHEASRDSFHEIWSTNNTNTNTNNNTVPNANAAPPSVQAPTNTGNANGVATMHFSVTTPTTGNLIRLHARRHGNNKLVIQSDGNNPYVPNRHHITPSFRLLHDDTTTHCAVVVYRHHDTMQMDYSIVEADSPQYVRQTSDSTFMVSIPQQQQQEEYNDEDEQPQMVQNNYQHNENIPLQYGNDEQHHTADNNSNNMNNNHHHNEDIPLLRVFASIAVAFGLTHGSEEWTVWKFGDTWEKTHTNISFAVAPGSTIHMIDTRWQHAHDSASGHRRRSTTRNNIITNSLESSFSSLHSFDSLSSPFVSTPSSRAPPPLLRSVVEFETRAESCAYVSTPINPHPIASGAANHLQRSALTLQPRILDARMVLVRHLVKEATTEGVMRTTGAEVIWSNTSLPQFQRPMVTLTQFAAGNPAAIALLEPTLAFHISAT
ncbi:Hypothetical protein, putative [Bodo saltans]|uniref:Uncharacterized protein n=1 Tax=Bodo saltans TaxID=75058 RepID=A0A0S4JCK4_BODSA|nr:Hypothetical protein, putative [Bodo saltans]|eukprot:CUG86647.1 Hypothetical protein, putative [Bodo saltans]